MIQSVEIQNFKCLERLAVPAFGNLTLIGGKNNVGKSALLEALFLFFDRVTANQPGRHMSWRGLGSVSTRPESLWAPIFTDYDLGRTIRISLVYDNRTEELNIKVDPKFRLPPSPLTAVNDVTQVKTDEDAPPTEALQFVYSAPKRQPQTTYSLVDRERGPAQYVKHLEGPLRAVSYLGSRIRPTVRDDAKSFGELDRSGRSAMAADFLRVIEPRLKSLSIIPEGDEPVIHGDVGLPSKIPVVFMGDGVSRLLTILLAMVRSSGNVVLIDEFENGFHHSVQADVWKATAEAARALRCQVIATTHSYEFLRCACEVLSGELADSFRYIRLEQSVDGPVAHVFDHEMLATAMATGMEVR